MRLLVDRSVGEVYGPSVMGDSEPTDIVRPVSDAIKYCREQGVQVSRNHLISICLCTLLYGSFSFVSEWGVRSFRAPKRDGLQAGCHRGPTAI